MTVNTFFGKKDIIEAIINNEKASLLTSKKQRELMSRFGHLAISLFGYPLTSDGRIQMCHLLKMIQPEDSPLLDIGSSFGTYAFELCKRGFEVTAIDINETNIQVANRIKKILGWGPEFIVSDIEKLDSFENNYFSTILMSHVIEHIKNPVEILDFLSKKLKPGGSIIITTAPITEDNEIKEGYDDFTLADDSKINPEKINGLLKGAKHYRFGLTEQKLCSLLTEAGFTIEKIDHLKHPKLLMKSQFLFPIVYPMYLLFSPFSKKLFQVNIKARKVT